MRFNKYPTNTFVIAKDIMEQSVFEVKETIKAKGGESEQFSLEGRYTPLLKLSAVKEIEKKGQKFPTGVYNTFFVDLTDLTLYYKLGHGVEDKFKKVFDRKYVDKVLVQRNDILMEMLRLSPQAMQFLGYLVAHGTTNLEDLDINQQQAAKELVVKKFAIIFSSGENESVIKKLVRDITDWRIVTTLYYIKQTISAPKFDFGGYDISTGLYKSDVLEESFKKQPIRHTPDKIRTLLSYLFHCSVHVEEIIYLPFIECKYYLKGEEYLERKYLPAIKGQSEIWQYPTKKKLKTLTIGTKGYGLDSVPIEAEAINFSNVAGMSDLKEHIRESIIYPLTNKKLAEEFGKKSGGAVLFYGPPGCGKTYIARATVGECGFNFYSFSIQEIIGDTPETAAAKLHQAFQEAREGTPAILFFDEIDALGRSRDNMQGPERMLINQFLTDMEGVESTNENLLVIGATNAPWDIDPALRRAGRFTTQVFVPPPDIEARHALFNIHTKGRPLSEDLDFDELARISEEYSSSDITAICEEAAKIPWGETVHGGTKRKINMKDFRFVMDERDSSIIPWLRQAEKQITDSGEIDVYEELSDYILKRAGGIEESTKPSIRFDDVGGMKDIKEEIKRKIVYPIMHPDMSEQYGREVGGAVLLYGPPGCGKTYIARATAGECESSFFNVKITDLMSPIEGETERRIHAIFERASRNAPSIIFIDEIDAVAGTRSVGQKGSERRLVNQLLTEMDGFQKRVGVMILGATNAPWDIDPALRRSGRFSDQIYIPPPDLASRLDIFKIHLKGKPIVKDLDYNVLAELSEGFSGADIKVLCAEAAEIPWKESMESGKKRPVGLDDFNEVLSGKKSSLLPWFQQAKKMLADSGEADLYTELNKDIVKFIDIESRL